MRSKFLFPGIALFGAFLLISWGVTGHRSIAKIAENHLSTKTKVAVKAILGDEEMPMVSTFADEIRSNPKYREQGSWHYINLPENLNYSEFVKALKSDTSANVYNALLKMVAELKNKKTIKEERLFALKMVIHLVGDLHQPMHVSRAEDEGGNKIKLRFNYKQSNLHSIWDSGLIEYNGLTFTEMATALDNVSDAKIKEWQSDELTKWLFESYQISAKLYKEIEGKASLDYNYYPQHSKIYKERIQKAGIRLAGLLNEIYR
ncbi:MAG TPA: S1/P1 nuclease [Pelobium sp.]|nr:S1/P1 nuclease [Pelobium sp.]